MSHLSNPLEGTAALFGGLCYDEEEGSWMKCYVIAHDGKIDYADPHYDRIRETPGSQLEITAAQVSLAVDKLGLLFNVRLLGRGAGCPHKHGNSLSVPPRL